YFDDHLYDPDEMRRRLGTGAETACVAVDPAGEVVGYFELLLQPPGTTLGEAATAIVDPRYRGHHLFERMKAFIRDHGRNLGLRVALIDLDGPLATPAAVACTGQLEALGFFFAGIVPEKPAGDFLRLQYLNDVATDAGQIQLASDFGKELLEYVLEVRGSAGG